MSKVKAFICDYRNHLVMSDNAVGVSDFKELFSDRESYTTISNPDKAEIHSCLDCYREFVLNPAQNTVNRRKEGEDVYRLKVKELTHGWLQVTVKNYRLFQK